MAVFVCLTTTGDVDCDGPSDDFVGNRREGCPLGEADWDGLCKCPPPDGVEDSSLSFVDCVGSQDRATNVEGEFRTLPVSFVSDEG